MHMITGIILYLLLIFVGIRRSLPDTPPLRHPASLLVNVRKTRSCRHLLAFYCHVLETVVAVAHDAATVRVWFGSASQETVPLDETLIYL
ncbi:hypothetical protein FJTKL_05180 [Diaporthe vaccinii]|uniref:Secreted protein n=1 Tax=Diaporthe vaccinii TaxID=105482 RepID=A0ABR4FFD3_9PEZI